MPRLFGFTKIPILLIPQICVGMALAAPPDPRLLALVPPGAAIVAGISAPTMQDQPDNFILATHYNSIDLEDFIALTGADGTRIVHQIVFVAGDCDTGQLNEHSLLASGRFDQPHIFKSAADAGAAVTNYRKIPVLEIQPLARERGIFRDVRWLAVLDSSVVVFGTVASTRLELDRYLAHIQTDESLRRRLSHLRSKDQTWSVVSASAGTASSHAVDPEIDEQLAKLNPELAELAQSGNELEFGIYYGRRVEVEYEVTVASTEASQVDPDAFRQSAATPPSSAALMPILNKAMEGNALHGVIAVSMLRYKAWLSGVSAREFDRDRAIPRDHE